ncbi:MAG TPA: hypothetical protein VEI28_01435, partial [Thermodesulfovibrionales bacterium]|nr:hypothetical protein [Thermodesulfovibrionales bacterium]
ERKGLAVMGRMEEGNNVLLGNLNNYLKETLHFILRRGKVTARQLSNSLRLEANTSGTRLLNLHKKRLVKRIEETRDGGRIWVYEKV